MTPPAATAPLLPPTVVGQALVALPPTLAAAWMAPKTPVLHGMRPPPSGPFPGDDPVARPRTDATALGVAGVGFTPVEVYNLSRLDGTATMADIGVVFTGMDEVEGLNLVRRAWVAGVVRF